MRQPLHFAPRIIAALLASTSLALAPAFPSPDSGTVKIHAGVTRPDATTIKCIGAGGGCVAPGPDPAVEATRALAAELTNKTPASTTLSAAQASLQRGDALSGLAAVSATARANLGLEAASIVDGDVSGKEAFHEAGGITGAMQAAGIDGSATLTTGVGIPRAIAGRASDDFDPRVFGAVGDGGSHTVSATLGLNTLASLTNYTLNGKKPYSWVNSYPYGNLFNLPATQAVAAGATTIQFGLTRTEGLTILTSGSAASGQNIVPMSVFGISIGDVVNSDDGSIPAGTTVTSNYLGSIALSANLTAAIPAGFKIHFAHASPTTPVVTRGSTTSGGTIVPINAAPGLDARLAGATVTGMGIAPGTTVAALSGTTLTLSQATTAAIGDGSNLTIQASYKLTVEDAGGIYPGQAILGTNLPSGVQVDWVNPSTLEVGLSLPTLTPVLGNTALTFTQPWLDKVTAGMHVTGQPFPAGERVQSVDTAAQTVTLSAATRSDITAATSNYEISPASQSSTITFYSPFTDSQAAALQMDEVGIVAARQAASAAGGGTLKFPSGKFLISALTVDFPLSADSNLFSVGLDGNGIGSTILELTADLGPGRAALSCGDPTGQADNGRGIYANGGMFCPGELRDFTLTAPTSFNVGSRPKLGGTPIITNGFRFGPRKNMRRVNVTGFYFGLEGTADWTTWDYAVVSKNFSGYRLGDPTVKLFGDLNFDQVFFGGNAFAGISISSRTAMFGSKFGKSWIADNPYGIWFEPGLPTEPLAMEQTTMDNINFEGSGCVLMKDGNIVDSLSGSNNHRGIESVRITSSYTYRDAYAYNMPSGCAGRAYYDLSYAYGLVIDSIPYNAYRRASNMDSMIRIHSARDIRNNKGGVLISGDSILTVMDSFGAVCEQFVTGGGGINSDFGSGGSWHLVEWEIPGVARGRVMPLDDGGATTLPRGTLLEEVPYNGRTAVQRAGQATQGTAPVVGTAMADHPSCNMSGKFVPVVESGQEIPLRVSASVAAGSLVYAPQATGTVPNTAPGIGTTTIGGNPVGIVTDTNSGSTSLVWMRKLGGIQ